MGDLSKNFSRSEFACRCGCGFDDIDAGLVNTLQELRDRITAERGEDTSIHINCGCRCPKHNAAVGGSPQSQHTLGRAADIRIEGLTPKEIVRYARLIPEFCGIGLYSWGAHVDVRAGARVEWNYSGKD